MQMLATKFLQDPLCNFFLDKVQVVTMGCERIIQFFFHAILNIKLYHWQTKKYPRHIASDTLFTNLLASMDSFIETYIGKYERPKFDQDFSIDVVHFSDKNIKDVLKEYSTFLSTEVPKYLHPHNDTDLLNIRDDILGKINQTLYLFTLF
jgi:phenylalanine-4-hydroxylase